MTLQELKSQARQLSESDRWELVNSIIESLQTTPIEKTERSGAIQQMKGLLKTNQTAPNDQEVRAMLDEHRMEKYG
ncbi:MAG: hypothetical protein DCF22_15150 [Leptolyngbya sp.]|nr:MAG: hypothetical protein DCF22_15150 [Leptolyngbya sp.]